MYKRILIALFLVNSLYSAGLANVNFGWYLTFNGKDWNGSEAIPNNAVLNFGVQENNVRTVCYNFAVSKISLNNVVIAQPTGIKNPWVINLGTVLAGKTGTLTLEIDGKNCTTNGSQHWIISAVIVAATGSSSTTTTSTVTASSISSGTATNTAPSGATIQASMLKAKPRTQHIVAKTSIINKNASVSKCVVVMGYPETNNYQIISNLKLGNAVKKNTPTGAPYLEYTFTGVPLNATVTAICEYDVTTYEISSNLSSVANKTYNTTTQDYKWYTQSISSYCDLGDTKLKTICDPIWSQSGGNYLTYAKKCAEWMTTNTVWSQSNGMKKSTDFFSSLVNGKYTGDCGSLSNGMSAMLRYKGIPAKLLIGYGASNLAMTASDCKNHAWLEFYLQDFGWVPIDPSFRVNNKVELGYVSHKGVIINYDAWYNLTVNGYAMNNIFIQDFLWTLSGNAPAGSINAVFEAVSSNFKE